MKKSFSLPETSNNPSNHTPEQMAHIREVVKGLPAEFRSVATTIGMFATSGLNSHFVMRSMPHLLRKVVPIDLAGYFWANEEGEMVDAYVETPHFLRAEVILSCLKFQQEAKGNWPSFQENVLAGPCVAYLQSYQTAHFYQSEHYKLVYDPIQIQHILDVVVHDGNRPYGAFLLMRKNQSAPFSPTELQFLKAIAELLTYAHTLPPAQHIHASRSYDAGMLVLSEHQEIVFCNLSAHQILWMLSRNPAIPLQLDNDDSLPSLVRNHCSDGIVQARLHGLYQEKYSNHWGEFLLC